MYHQKKKKNTQDKKSLGKICEIYWEWYKNHTFSRRLVTKWGRIWRVCVWTRWFWKREKRTRRWIVTRCEGKMKSFETWPEKDPQCAKHVIFATRVSHKQVTKASRQKPLWQNFEKLSKCFSQLKIHPRGSREGSRKSFWVYPARNLKTQIFENFSKSFSQLGHWPAKE